MKLTAKLEQLNKKVIVRQIAIRTFRIVLRTPDGQLSNIFNDIDVYNRLVSHNFFHPASKKVDGYTLRSAFEAAMSAEQILAANTIFV